MEPTEENLRAWDEAHRRHAETGHGAGLPPLVRKALGDLHGRRVLHLGCGAGEATAELATLGAMVTGVDPSAERLEVARERAQSVLWIEAELDALPSQLRRGRFDLVYAGPGTLASLGDIDGLTAGAAAAARKGGDVLLFDEHPVAACVDGLLHWRESYFDGIRLGQVVNAFVRSGLQIEALEEYPARPHGARRLDARVPGEFLLYARRIG
jgi:predicted TPR repeat methyltransferase